MRMLLYERLAMPSSPSQFRWIRLARPQGSSLCSGCNERCSNVFLALASGRMQAGTLESTRGGQPRIAEHRGYSGMPPPGTQTAAAARCSFICHTNRSRGPNFTPPEHQFSGCSSSSLSWQRGWSWQLGASVALKAVSTLCLS
jgi:hypothetical protein